MDGKMKPTDEFKLAKKFNKLALVIFCILIIGFNLVFWAISAREYVKAPESFVDKDMMGHYGYNH